MDFMLLGI